MIYLERVYIETTIPSYLVARPSRDIVVAAQQQITQEWWDESRSRYRLFVSEAVLDECGVGDPLIGERRLKLLADLPILQITNEVVELAENYARILQIPERAKVDAIH